MLCQVTRQVSTTHAIRINILTESIFLQLVYACKSCAYFFLLSKIYYICLAFQQYKLQFAQKILDNDKECEGELINMTRAWDKEKFWVPDRNRTHDLPNTGRALYPLSYENSWRARSFNWVYIWQVSCILASNFSWYGMSSISHFTSKTSISLRTLHVKSLRISQEST